MESESYKPRHLDKSDNMVNLIVWDRLGKMYFVPMHYLTATLPTWEIGVYCIKLGIDFLNHEQL